MADAVKKRGEIDIAYKWHINDLMASDEIWKSQAQNLKDEMGSFSDYKNNFTDSAVSLLACLNERNRLSHILENLYVYANMKFHEDGSNPVYQGMADQAENILTRLSSTISFVEPALLSLDEKTLADFIKDVPELEIYSHYFNNLLRRKEHILSPELEETLANAQELAAAPDSIFTMLNDADMKFGVIKDETGQEVELTHGRYGAMIESPDRDVRKNAFETMYAAYIKLKNTLAATYSASVKADHFFAQARKYASVQESSLSRDNIPPEVYTNLIETVHEFLPYMHKYVNLRKKALKVDELHMYDVYTPIVSGVNTECPFHTAKETVLKALSVMGDDYTDAIKASYENGWIDVYENEGKHSGAYCWGAFGCHPFVLLNYADKISDMFTLAHELGHAMHSFYTWNTQPYMYGDHTIFLAEIASTVNEALLMEYLRKTTTDKTMSKYLVNYFLEQFKGTVFRQTMFAEFEMLAHKMSEEGEALTSESLNTLYRG
ncbi:MAG: oligoendopeptidase F, partial [Clostridiales bacterium]|nr:oligoendopeptidase F [Clostridiales bacterium]